MLSVKIYFKTIHLMKICSWKVSQVRVENSSLLKRFTDISQKYNEAAVDNRVLKADVETLRAKVRLLSVFGEENRFNNIRFICVGEK